MLQTHEKWMVVRAVAMTPTKWQEKEATEWRIFGLGSCICQWLRLDYSDLMRCRKRRRDRGEREIVAKRSMRLLPSSCPEFLLYFSFALFFFTFLGQLLAETVGLLFNNSLTTPELSTRANWQSFICFPSNFPRWYVAQVWFK